MQDYKQTKAVNLWLYDSLHEKRRHWTLQILMQDPDQRKTVVSTLVNFICQKDAWLAVY